MDLLFKRYASPFPFLDNVIKTNRLCEFIESFADTIHEERETKFFWEYYLHRVFDKSYNEYIEAIEVERDNKNMSLETIETTIQNSKNILANFNPEERG